MVKVLSVNGKIPLVDGKAISAAGGASVELDTTLTQSGKAADAKAVGDALAGKQDTISDLEAIRTGATKGATALQSVPKPLTYDYMPEGYPTKSVQTTTLMEEQQLAFAEVKNGVYGSSLTTQLNIVGGQTYTVSWDGTEYECVCGNKSGVLFIGNISLANMGEDSGEPFLYNTYNNAFMTFDASPSHTISVKSSMEVITPIAEEFLPNTKNTTVFYYSEN